MASVVTGAAVAVASTGATTHTVAAAETNTWPQVVSLHGDTVDYVPGIPSAPEKDVARALRTAAGSTVWHDVLVVKAAINGAPASNAQSDDAAITRTIGLIDEFYNQRTDGQVRFRLQSITGWQSKAMSCADAGALWSAYANDNGFQRSPNKHMFLYIPGATDCVSVGLAEVGAQGASASVGYIADETFRADIVGHELGHNLGLMHANALTGCASGTADGTPSGDTYTNGCRTESYGDWYDIMGISWVGDFINRLPLSATHFNTLGVTREGATPLTSSQYVSLRAEDLSAAPGEQRLLTVQDPGGDTYYAQYVSGERSHTWMNLNQVGDGGLLVRKYEPKRPGWDNYTPTSAILDAPNLTGARSGSHDHALDVGHGTLTTGSGRVSLRVVARNGDRAIVEVRVDGAAPDGPVPSLEGPDATSPDTATEDPDPTPVDGKRTDVTLPPTTSHTGPQTKHPWDTLRSLPNGTQGGPQTKKSLPISF